MSWNRVGNDIERGPMGMFKWIVIAALACFALFGTLGVLGKIGGTATDRVVLEQSFQYKEGMKQRARTLEASIAEIDVRISQDPSNQDLRNQRSYLVIQLNAMKKD